MAASGQYLVMSRVFFLDGKHGKKTKSATLIVLSVVLPSFAVTIIPVLAFILYRKKKIASKDL